jgi:hypothetical protein
MREQLKYSSVIDQLGEQAHQRRIGRCRIASLLASRGGVADVTKSAGFLSRPWKLNMMRTSLRS